MTLCEEDALLSQHLLQTQIQIQTGLDWYTVVDTEGHYLLHFVHAHTCTNVCVCLSMYLCIHKG